MYFSYGTAETEYLKRKDKRLGEAIDTIGHIEREVDADLFTSVVRNIAGQQISSAAHKTVWARLTGMIRDISAESINAASRQQIQSCGISYRKADYIKDFAAKVCAGEFDVNALWHLPDAEVIKRLCALKGIGVWTAEMLLIFCMQRPNVISFGDLGIQRALCMLYNHKQIDRKLFEKYVKRYSPYCSVASLYLWEISSA
ncbi:MAG: DNA-3-methyladenine glycosylase 2 family protein [Clostridiales bacterium]|jgi:DNA-3-methyladenine glycosylase II|nr:DNA-3-methyladenine glycosylase 2 family protein [Clostridiales bacterium]